MSDTIDYDKDKPSYDHEGLRTVLRAGYEAKQPYMIHGTTGIGKSETVREIGETLAEEEEKEFLDWNSLNRDEKLAYLQDEKDLSDKFLYIDIRLAQYDASDIKGLPDFADDYVDWKAPLWIAVICKEDAHGIVFLDEFNLAPNTVQSSFYELIQDGQVNARSLSDDVYVCGAGNRLGKDRMEGFDMAGPLRDRFKHVELKVPSVGDLTSDHRGWIDWAVENDVDPRIVSFMSSSMGRNYLFTFEGDKKDDDVFATPRSWAELSEMIKDVDDVDTVHKIARTAVGEGVSDEFRNFLELEDDYDLETYIDNPSKINEERTGVKHSIISSVAQRYKENPEKHLEETARVGLEVDEEFSVLLLNMMVKGSDEGAAVLSKAQDEDSEVYSEAAFDFLVSNQKWMSS